MTKRLTALTIAMGLFAFGLEAQEQKRLSLDEAIVLSLKNSKQLKSSQAKIEEATAALKEAVQKKLPDVKASGAYLWFNNPNIDLKTKNSGNTGGQGLTPLPNVSQAVYGIVNASLP